MKRALILGFVLIVLVLAAFSQTTRNTSDKNKSDEQTPPPVVSINPSNIDFKDQVARKPSKPLRVTVTNSGGKDLYINSVAIEGDNKDDFSMIRDTCTGATIPANKSCVVDIALTPEAAERRVATLAITDNALDSPQRVTLIGNGINSSAVRPGAMRTN